jgi:hypothetical protein
MSDLEQRYRRALRWYPKKWRATNEDAVVGTLLDVAEDDHRAAPARGELADLRAAAVAARLGPTGRLSANVRDRVSALTLGLGAAIGGAGLLALLWDARWMPVAAREEINTFGPFASAGVILYGLWILAFVVALLGLRRLTRVILLTTLPVAAALYFFAPALRMNWSPTLTTIGILALLALMSLAGRPAQTPSGVRRTLISAGGWGAAIAGTLWFQKATQGGVAGRTDWFIGPLWQWLYFAIPFALVLALVLRQIGQRSWAGATLIMLIPLFLFVVFGWSSQDLVERGIWLVVILTAIGLVYLVARLFGVRIRITRV